MKKRVVEIYFLIPFILVSYLMSMETEPINADLINTFFLAIKAVDLNSTTLAVDYRDIVDELKLHKLSVAEFVREFMRLKKDVAIDAMCKSVGLVDGDIQYIKNVERTVSSSVVAYPLTTDFSTDIKPKLQQLLTKRLSKESLYGHIVFNVDNSMDTDMQIRSKVAYDVYTNINTGDVEIKLKTFCHTIDINKWYAFLRKKDDLDRLFGHLFVQMKANPFITLYEPLIQKVRERSSTMEQEHAKQDKDFSAALNNLYLLVGYEANWLMMLADKDDGMKMVEILEKDEGVVTKKKLITLADFGSHVDWLKKIAGLQEAEESSNSN